MDESTNQPTDHGFEHYDTSDWTPEDHYEQSISGYWCQHAEEAKDIYVKFCATCDKESEPWVR